MLTTVTFDPATFAKDVKDLLKGSPLAAQFPPDGVVSITGWDFGKLLVIAQAACASVEIVKANAVAEADPTGTLGLKFDSTLALHTAVNVACDCVKFGGPLGWVLNMLDRPILNCLVEAVMTGFKGKNWLADAKAILKLA